MNANISHTNSDSSLFSKDSDISTSGHVGPESFHVSNRFSDFTELPSKGYCRLVKAQRYGVWNVLKGLKPGYASEEQYREMISKEFSLMVGLSHPNIVRTYGLEQIPEWGTCIVMEFVDGRTLSDFLSENPTVEQRRKVVDELLEAMAYFHKKQIVHQDLKPSNILITNDGNHVKIIDFGLSDSREYAILKEPAYTKAYAAPEQLSGGEIDNRTDLYAFGLILQQLFQKRYAKIAKRCLHPQREKRCGSSEAVLDAIRRTDLKRKWLPAAICAALLFIVLSAFLSYYFKNHKELLPDKISNELVKEQNNVEEESIPINNKTTTTKSKKSDIQKDDVSESKAQEMLDQYIYNLKFEFDSIIRPFDKEVQEGEILYYEFYTCRLQIALNKMLIHYQKCRQQLPKDQRSAYQLYAEELSHRYYLRRVSVDSNGNIIYPYFGDLYRKGEISKKEYVQLRNTYEKEMGELRELSYQLRKESLKD